MLDWYMYLVHSRHMLPVAEHHASPALPARFELQTLCILSTGYLSDYAFHANVWDSVEDAHHDVTLSVERIGSEVVVIAGEAPEVVRAFAVLAAGEQLGKWFRKDMEAANV